MSRYIDADLLEVDLWENPNAWTDEEMGFSRAQVDRQPTADVQEIVHGCWRRVTPMIDTIECSVCGHQELSEEFSTPYCPWCGAKMCEEMK